MLYLAIEHYDNGEQWEDHYDKDTVIGVFETKELAEKEIECMIEEARKGVDVRNERVKTEECPFCEDPCTTAECFERFKRTSNGYAVDDSYCSTYSYSYSMKKIELNQRIN